MKFLLTVLLAVPALFGQPAALFGQAPALFGQAPALFGQAPALSGQPAALSGQPAARPAPELAIRRIGEPDLKLSAYKGKVVLLALLNTGCTHCQHFAQELGGLQKDYGTKGVQVLAVVFDKDARTGLAAFRDKFVKGFPIGYSDEATVLKWLQQPPEDGYFVPIVAFINRRGVIESQHPGDDNLFQDPETNIRKKLDRMVGR